MTELDRCLDEQRQAARKVAQEGLSPSERFLAKLWLEDWIKEELLLRREVGREKRRDHSDHGVPTEDAA